MKIKPLRKSLLIAQTLLFALNSGHFACARSPEPTILSSEEASVGYAPFKLREKDKQGFVINLHRHNPALSGKTHLASIDGKDVAAMSIVELEKLLCGSVGSSMKVGIIKGDGNTDTLDLERISAKDFHLPLQGGNAFRSDMFEYRMGGYSFNIETDNVDVFARAIATYAYERIKELDYLPKETKANALVNLIVLNDILGNLPEAQNYYQTLTGITTDIKDKFHTHRLIDQSAILNSLGQTKAAEAFKKERFLNVPEPVDTSNFQVVKNCFTCIENKNKTGALKEIATLLKSYSEDSVYIEDHRLRLDLFSAIVTLARAFSDKGWVAESNNILGQLKTIAQRVAPGSSANYLVYIELAINAELSKKKSDDRWSDVRVNCQFLKHEENPKYKYDYTFSERLRRMAIVYCYAGELKRAEILLNQAFLHQNDMVADSTYISRPLDGELGEKIFLYLDATIISAKLNNWNKVQEYRKELDKLPSLIVASYGPTVVEIARLYIDANKTDEALAFLKHVSEAEVHKEKKRSSEKILDQCRSIIDFTMAQLYYKKENMSEALKACDSALAKCYNNKKRQYLLLAAQISEQTGEKAKAADYYYQAALASDGHISLYNFEDQLKRQYLEKAYVLADSCAKDMSPNVLASICRDLAEFYMRGQTDRDKASALYKRYLDNTQDDDSKKAQILQKMSHLSCNSGGGTELNKGATLAENSNTVQARHLWIELAGKELTNGNLDACMKHARHALSLYSDKDYTKGNTDGLVSSSNLLGRLALAKHEAEAVTLQKESIKRVSQVTGGKSPQAASEVALLFFFYSHTNKYKEALETLDQLMAFDMYSMDIEPNYNPFDMSHCGIGPYCLSPREIMGRLRREAEGAKNKEFALSIENKMLQAQRKQLPKDSRLIAETLKSLGEVYKKNGQKKEALNALDESWKIYKLYFPLYTCCLLNGNSYPELLSWAGRQADYADWQAQRNQSPYLRKNIGLKKSTKNLERATPDEMLQEAIEQFEAAKAKTPYFPETAHLLSSVIVRARVAKKPDVIYKYSLAQLDLLERGGTSKRQEMLRCYEQIIEASIEMQKLDDTLKWLDKMEKFILVNPSFPEVLKLAELEEKGKNFEKAAKLLEQAEKLLSDKPEDTRHMYMLERLWKKIDRKDKSEKIKAQREKRETESGIPGPDFMRKRALDHVQKQVDYSKGIVESNIRSIQPLIEKEDWKTLERVSMDLGRGWGYLTADERQEMSLKLIEWGEMLIKMRKFESAYKLMSCAYLRPAKLSFPPAVSSRMADIGELLMQMHEVSRADYYLDSAKVFLKMYEGQSPLKKSLELKIERLQKLQKALRMREFVYGYTYPEVAPPQDYQLERFLFASKSLAEVSKANGLYGAGKKREPHDFDPAILKDGMSFIPARKCPSGAIKLSESESSLELAPGDYKATNLALHTLKITKPGTVRIFLSGINFAKGPVFTANKNSSVNPREMIENNGPVYRLELWYDGEGIIKIDENSKFSGVIYAPNARIEICKNAQFGGMLLGQDIVINEDVSMCYDSRRDYLK